MMGFASEWSIFEWPESGVKICKLKIFDMRLISRDHVTYLSEGHNSNCILL